MLIDSRGTHSLEQCLHLLHTVLEARDITRVEVDVSRKPRKFEWGTNAFGGPLGRETSLRGDERHGEIVGHAYRRTDRYKIDYSARNLSKHCRGPRDRRILSFCDDTGHKPVQAWTCRCSWWPPCSEPARRQPDCVCDGGLARRGGGRAQQ